MRVLACDIGSSNLKLQLFEHDTNGVPYALEESHSFAHQQNWLNDHDPLQSATQWMASVTDFIASEYGQNVNAVGISTFREAVVGFSENDVLVFAGTNVRAAPVGALEQATAVMTLAGWMCKQLTGQSYVTAGQRDAGEIYLRGYQSNAVPWVSTRAAGVVIKAAADQLFDVYIGGTDEQLSYKGSGLYDDYGPELAIATGTFWSVSRLAQGAVARGMRRTNGVAQFKTVDSYVMYQWGPMMAALERGDAFGAGESAVPDEFFGRAERMWFEDGASADVVHRAAVNDLWSACRILRNTGKVRAVVHGGGVHSDYVRALIGDACPELKLTYMDDDATLLGCASVALRASERLL